MTNAEMKEAIARAHPRACADLRAQLYAVHAAGGLTDDDAAELDAAIEARRKGPAPAPAAVPAGVSLGTAIARVSIFPPKRRQASPDKARSRERRRLIARSSPLPPQLSARFTEGQAAVLGVVGDEMAARGVCALSIGEIAARAGVCHRLAQGALRLAEGDGLVTITERPRKGQKHQTNLIRVLSREWAAWLAKRRPTGCRSYRPTEIKGFSSSLESSASPRRSGATGFRRGDSGSGVLKRSAAGPRSQR